MHVDLFKGRFGDGAISADGYSWCGILRTSPVFYTEAVNPPSTKISWPLT